MQPEENNAVPAQDATPPVSSPEAYSWQASEYIYHDKSAGWYALLWLAVAIICGVLAWFKQWLSIAVVVAMGLAVTVYSRKEPRTLTYSLSDKGITVEGVLKPFGEFKFYSVHKEVAWHEIDLEPSKRFIPRLTLLCENDDLDKIEAILTHHIPRADRELDWIERLSRYFRF